jgi:hypothetical protein
MLLTLLWSRQASVHLPTILEFFLHSYLNYDSWMCIKLQELDWYPSYIKTTFRSILVNHTARVRNQVASALVWYVISHWHAMDWIRIQDISVVLLALCCSCGESCLFVSWCAGGRCGMAGSNEDHGRSRRPGVEDQGWSHRSGTQWPDDQEVGWCCVRSVLCTCRRGAWVSWLSLKTKVDGLSVIWLENHHDGLLVVWPQNH